jgi:serine/threonine protein phosphatase PrpC
VAAGVSDRGHRHRRNEDAMAVDAVTGHDGRPAVVAVVCDGVSSSPRPDEASAVAADTACRTLGDALRGGAHPEQATRAAIAAAAGAVARLAGRPGESNAPACTIVSAVVTTDLVTVGWVGDSRAYWLAAPDPDAAEPDPDDTLPGGPGPALDPATARLVPGAGDDTLVAPSPSALLTEDDSWAVRMIALGEMTEAQAYADRRAHAIIAWLGADAGVVRPRVVSIRPDGPGAVLLCSDGLWNYLQAAATLAAFALPRGLTEPLRQAQALTDYALECGGADNITVALVPFPPGRHAGSGAPEENRS